MLVRSLTPPDAGDFSNDIIDGSADNAEHAGKICSNVCMALQTLPFFGGSKVVWLKYANFLGDSGPGKGQDAVNGFERILDVIERGLGIDYRALYASRGAAAAGNFAAGMARLADELGREPEQHELEPLTWAILKAGQRQTGADVMRSLQETRMLNYKTLAAFSDIDVYLCPVMGQPVPEIGYVDPNTVEPREINKRQGRLYPFTPPFNFSGQPSMSLPLEMDAKGLPGKQMLQDARDLLVKYKK